MLTGTWKQTNSESDDSYQEATITDSTIEEYWVADDTKGSLLGRFPLPHPPQPTSLTHGTPATDTESDSSAPSYGQRRCYQDLLTYKDGTLSYGVTAIGVTKTVTMKKIN